jgi:hypothetical protein
VRISTTGLILTSAALLAGCNRLTSEAGPHHGRYLGVGIYAAGEAWSRMKVPATSGKPTAARTADDEQIIVVVDSNTGEIRQCGDMSGYCTGMNPWSKALLASQQAPVDLAKPPGPPEQPASTKP